MRVLSVLVALCIVGMCFAATGARMKALASDGKPSAVPSHWQEIDSDVDLTGTVNLTVALQRNNMDYIAREVEARSDPRNPNYGNWFTREELLKLQTPEPVVLEKVLEWLHSVGVKKVQVGTNKDTLVLPAVPLAVAEKVLGLAFRTYQEKATDKIAVRAVGLIRVPETVASYIQTIVGASGFPVLHGMVKSETPADIQVVPSVINTRYNVSIDAPVAPGNLKAVAEFQGQYIRESDVCTFYTTYGLKGNCKLNQIFGFNLPLVPGVESTLDVEYIAATASDSLLDYYIFGGMDFCSDMVEWTTKLLSLSNPGYVHSVSYGAQDYTPICDATVRNKIDQDLMTLSGRGISIIIASGDMGSGQYSRAGYNGGYLVPSWPAESPYATAVGATFFYNGDLNTESAVTQFGSGGGFSWNEQTQPSWQQSAIQTFFSNYPSSNLPPQGSYNPTGRGTPDVAALGENYVLYIKGQTMPGIGGTSASTPVFAGMVTRLNSIRLLAGKATLGLLNPLLYQNPQAFYDVTIGTNAVGQNTIGWNCQPGWDPVTGLGTPSYKKLEAIVQALP